MGPDGLVAVFEVPRRGPGWLLACAIVGGFLAALFGTALVDLLKPKPPPAVIGKAAESHVAARFWDGSLMREFDDDLRLRSRIRQLVMPPYSIALWRTVDQTPDEVIAGRDRWLFLRYRVPGRKLRDEEIGAHGAGLVASIHDALASRGITLFVAPIPDKCMVYEEELPRAYAARPDLYHAFVRRLRERGVPTVDLLTPMRAERHLKVASKTDSHWTERGMVIAAREIAAAAGLMVPEEIRPTRIVPAGSAPEPGDILPLLGIRPEDVARAVHLREPAELFDVVDRDGKSVVRSDATGITPVILAGSSYSADTRFRDYLAHFIDQDVWKSAWKGLGADEPIRRALVEAARTRSPRIIVWELPAAVIFWPEAPLVGTPEILEAARALPDSRPR